MKIRFGFGAGTILALATLATLATLVGCGGTGADNTPVEPVVDAGPDVEPIDAAPPPEPLPVTLSITPATATVPPGMAQPFTATIAHATDKSITWSVREANSGTITADGVYTAPKGVGTVHIVAASVQDPAVRAVAVVKVAPFTVAVTPDGTHEIAAGAKVEYKADVSYTANPAVKWTVSGVGKISDTGVYEAPLTFTREQVTITATSVADPTRKSSVSTAVLPVQPTIVANGGPVLAKPVFTAITFPGETNLTAIESYVDGIGATPYWSAIGTEYGVAAGTSTAPVHLTEPAPLAITDDKIKTWLAAKLDGTHPEFPAPVPGSIYTIFYPAKTTIDLMGSKSCQAFGGYHTYATVGGTNVAYAVIPHCTFGSAADSLDYMLSTISHEYVEAATDPFWDTTPAFTSVDYAHIMWTYATGGEVGDLCYFDRSNYYKPSGFPYSVQRSWSAAAALAGHDPCAPAGDGSYFAAFPILDEDVTVDFSAEMAPPNGAQIPTKGIHIPVGQSRTIEVALYSDGPRTDWLVGARADVAALTGSKGALDFTFDTTTGNNGDRLKLTITAVSSNTDFGGVPFAVYAMDPATHVTHTFFGFVKN